MISVKDLSFAYTISPRESLNHLSFDLSDGESLAVIGPSQGGKTTFAYAVAGLLEKHFRGGRMSGTITTRIDGELPTPLSIGFVFQDVSLQFSGVASTVEEEIAFSLEQFGIQRRIIRDRIEQQLALFRMMPLRQRSPKSLSAGETQMLAVACEAAKHPRLFILDEPAKSLDAQNTQLLVEVLCALKRSSTIIMTDERTEVISQVCDKVLFLERGEQRFFGTPETLLTSPGIDLSSIEIPEWVEAQHLLGSRAVVIPYRESIQWLKAFRTSL